MNTYYPPTTHRLGAFRVVVTQMGASAYRASVMIGGGARHIADDVSATPARVAEVWDEPTPGDALAAAEERAREMMGAGEYRAWMGGEG